MSHEEVDDKRRDLAKALGKMVAEAMPRSCVEEAMVEAMEQAIVAYKIDPYHVKAEVDRLAHQVVQMGLGKLKG